MSGVDRDIQCGNSFAKLYELGCFDEEFIVYGCGYYQNGEITYLVSDNGDKIYRFRNEALRQHIYTTPVITKMASCQVSSGERETIRKNIKFELAKEIKAAYRKEYYQCIEQIDRIANNQTAEEFLQEEQRKIEGYFDKTSVEMFEGLCTLAYECKKIDENTYQSFIRWIKYAKKQMENDVIVKNDLHRVFFGFGYEQNRKTGYFADAQSMNVYKKREELLLTGAIVTPILSKEYWFKAINQLAKIRKDYIECLKSYVDNGYMEKTKIILSYETPFYQHLLHELQAVDLAPHEKNAVQLYLAIRGLFNKENNI